MFSVISRSSAAGGSCACPRIYKVFLVRSRPELGAEQVHAHAELWMKFATPNRRLGASLKHDPFADGCGEPAIFQGRKE